MNGLPEPESKRTQRTVLRVRVSGSREGLSFRRCLGNVVKCGENRVRGRSGKKLQRAEKRWSFGSAEKAVVEQVEVH